MLNGYSSSPVTGCITTLSKNTSTKNPCRRGSAVSVDIISSPLDSFSSNIDHNKPFEYTTLEDGCEDLKTSPLKAQLSTDSFNQTDSTTVIASEIDDISKKRPRDSNNVFPENQQQWNLEKKNDSLVIRTTDQNALSLMALASTTCGSDSVVVATENRANYVSNSTKRLRMMDKTPTVGDEEASTRLQTVHMGSLCANKLPSELSPCKQHVLVSTLNNCVHQQPRAGDSPDIPVPLLTTQEFVQHPEVNCIQTYSYCGDQPCRITDKKLKNSCNKTVPSRLATSVGPSSILKKKNERKLSVHHTSSHGRLHNTLGNTHPSTVPFMLAYKLPRSPTARAAIMLYPYPPLPPQCLPELRHSHHQALFLQYIKSESSPLKIQLAHFVIEHCTRSIPEELFRSDVINPDIQVIEDFVQQILYSVEVFGEQARYHHGRDPIPSDINELYISKWLQQNQHLLRPLQILYHRRQHQQGPHQTPVTDDIISLPTIASRGSSRNNKHRRKIGVSLGEELDALGVPKAINYENLTVAIANRGLVVQLPSHSDQSSKPTSTSVTSHHNTQYSRSFFNLLIAGRGDTRRSRLELPWGEVVKIKYNRTLLGIPDFVVEALGYRSFFENGGSHHLIPKVCAVSLEDSPYGVEILLFYRGMPCSKRSHTSHKQQPAPPSRRIANRATVTSDNNPCAPRSGRVVCSKRGSNVVVNRLVDPLLTEPTKKFSLLNAFQPPSKHQENTDAYSLNLMTSSSLLGIQIPKSCCTSSLSPQTTALPQPCEAMATLLTSSNQYSPVFDSDYKDKQRWENTSHCIPLYWEKKIPNSPPQVSQENIGSRAGLPEIANGLGETFETSECQSNFSIYAQNSKNLLTSYPQLQFKQEMLQSCCENSSKKLYDSPSTFQSGVPVDSSTTTTTASVSSSSILESEYRTESSSAVSNTNDCCSLNVSSPFTTPKTTTLRSLNHSGLDADNEAAMILMTSLLLEEPNRIAREALLLDRQEFSKYTEVSLLAREAFRSCSDTDDGHKQLSSTFAVDENGSPLHHNFAPTLLTSPQSINSFSIANNSESQFVENQKLLQYRRNSPCNQWV